MLESVLAIPFWYELAGALTGGLAGGMTAVRARYDIFGTVVIAIVAGLGGGIVRDILLQDFGIYAFQHPVLILACAVAGIFVFYFHKIATMFDWIVDLMDNLSVGLWGVVSVGKGLSAGLGIIPSIILGTICAVGGGILRDILMAQRPAAFQSGTLYGTAALFGTTAYALMKQNDFLGDYAAITCVVLVFILRYASEFFGWRTHPAEDYSDKVMQPVKKVAHVAAAPVKKVAKAAVAPAKKASQRHQENLASRPHREKASYRARLQAEASAKTHLGGSSDDEKLPEKTEAEKEDAGEGRHR